MELTIKIKDKDFDRVTTLLKTLNVEIIESNTPSSVMHEPMAKYGQKKRPSADEIEQMIIKKAIESRADAWKRVGRDEEMTVLANAGLDDFKNIIKDYETT